MRGQIEITLGTTTTIRVTRITSFFRDVLAHGHAGFPAILRCARELAAFANPQRRTVHFEHVDVDFLRINVDPSFERVEFRGADKVPGSETPRLFATTIAYLIVFSEFWNVIDDCTHKAVVVVSHLDAVDVIAQVGVLHELILRIEVFQNVEHFCFGRTIILHIAFVEFLTHFSHIRRVD